jgi:hypothetical protein
LRTCCLRDYLARNVHRLDQVEEVAKLRRLIDAHLLSHDLAQPRFLLGGEGRGHAVAASIARASRGYKSGRSSCLEIPVAASTRRTYRGDNARLALTNCQMFGAVQPQIAARRPWLPARFTASSRAVWPPSGERFLWSMNQNHRKLYSLCPYLSMVFYDRP